jgi:DNA repair exonuclease SbcCD ATPase subunit
LNWENDAMAKKAAKQPPHLRVRIEPKLLARLEKAREANGNTLTGEIVERLEETFSTEDKMAVLETVQQKRIEEQKERIEEVREYLAAQRARYDKDLASIQAESASNVAEIEDLKRTLEEYRANARAEIKKLETELGREMARLEGAEAIFDALVGEDKPSREALRSIALILAGNPGWSISLEAVQKVAQAANAAIHAAADKGTMPS